MDQPGLDFAEEVCKRCRSALIRMGEGHTEDAFLIIAGLRGVAEGIGNQAKMEAEVTTSNYDLTILNVDLQIKESEMED